MNEKQPTTEKESPPAFEGFPMPTKNFFSMPNAITDIIAEITNMAELKVIIYVIRHTWGYQEYGIPKAITIDEFMHGRKRTDGTRMDKGTGLSKQSVVDGVKQAEKHEYLVCVRDDTDKARVTKSYALKMRPDGVKDLDITPDVKNLDTENGCQETRHQMSKKLTPDVKEVDHGCQESAHRSEKDTKRNTPKKNTEEKQGDTLPSESETAPSGANAPTRAPIFFALLPWLWVDSKETPSKLLVQFAGTLHAGEQQRRLQILEHYQQMFQAKGFTVSVEMVTQPPEHTEDFAVLPTSLEAECEQVLDVYAPTGEPLSDNSQDNSTLGGPNDNHRSDPAQHSAHGARSGTALAGDNPPAQRPAERDTREIAELSTSQASSPQQSAGVEPTTEQDVLIPRPAQPEMPLPTARWCAETAVLVSEAIREKYYTPQQHTNQVNAARRMFRDFPSITRQAFEEIFSDWSTWWRNHDKGIFTLAGLLARGQDREVRLQTALDKLEARTSKPRKQRSSSTVTVPKDDGTVMWWDQQTGQQRLMTYAEADENGWNGGFGEYIQHTNYGRTVTA